MFVKSPIIKEIKRQIDKNANVKIKNKKIVIKQKSAQYAEREQRQ